ncbi:MAG: CHAT domain-containing protein, partial [Planctomycetota bacterium]
KSPEHEAHAASALARAAGRRRDRAAAARFRLLEGRALQRAGSPLAAVRALDRAESELRAVGDRERAAQALVLSVDALAVGGRIDEALTRAGRASKRIRGERAAAWRAALEINRANALRLRGDLVAATGAYEKAARVLQAAGEEHTAAIARFNAGVALMDGGEAEAALARFEASAAGFEHAEQTDMALEARYNLACAMVRCGRLGEGITALAALAKTHHDRGLDRREALCHMDLADALLRAGDPVAAEREALAAAEGFRRSRAHAEGVEALWLAAAAVAERSGGRARSHLARAARAAARTGRPALALRCDLLQLDLQLRSGRPFSHRELGAVQRKATRLGQEEIRAQCVLLRGEAALRKGATARALDAFSDPSLSRPGRPWIRVAAQTGRALAEAAAGKRGAAIARLRRVAEFLDAVRAGLPGAWLRASFVLERLDPYLVRIDLLLERGRPQDLREAEALLDALAARRFLEKGRPGGPAGRLREIRRRLGGIYGRLARGGGPTRGMDAAELSRLERDARRLERAAADAWRAAERAKRPARGVATASPRAAQLPDRVTAVHVWRRNGSVRGLVRQGMNVVAVADLGSVDRLEEERRMLAFHAERARRFPQTGAPRAVTKGLEALASRLLAPLAPDRWTSDLRLVLDPRLPDVPWILLPCGEARLGAGRRVLRVPALRVKPRARRGARGMTVLALGEDDLPGVARESLGLSRRARVVTGTRATKHAVSRALREREVVHLAGHGFDAPDAPHLGGVRVADAWFTAADVPDRVGARLVILSACRTGRQEGAAGEAWGGLPAALLSAGAEFVLWTADDVDDETTADLMASFHRARARHGPPRAFGAALGHVEEAQRHPAGLLEFRLSGIPA